MGHKKGENCPNYDFGFSTESVCFCFGSPYNLDFLIIKVLIVEWGGGGGMRRGDVKTSAR